MLDKNGVIDGNVTHIYKKNEEDAETPEEYEERMKKMSTEWQKVSLIANWIDKEMAKRILIIETGSEYSDVDLKQIIENTTLSEGIEFVFYDTFKSDKDAMGEWVAMKKTATILSEIAKKSNLFIGANIQLTDDAALCEPLDLTSNNIANSKQIKHVLDSLCLFREIRAEDYKYYYYWKNLQDNPIQGIRQNLDNNKRYYACIVDKNRAGSKPNLLFSLDLNTNIWTEEGRLDMNRAAKERNKRRGYSGGRKTVQEDGKEIKVTHSTYTPEPEPEEYKEPADDFKFY